MLARGAVFVLGLAACSSAPAAESCPAPSGDYFVMFTLADGDCGQLPSETVHFGDDGTTNGSVPAGAACTGTRASSADGCAWTIDVSCRGLSVEPGVTRERGTIHWGAGAREGAGTISLEVTLDDGRQCRGTYAVSYSRQR